MQPIETGQPIPGEKKDEVEFHRIVAWAKLAELCSQFLVKGRKVFVEGRLTTRSWTAQDGTQKQTTEIVISDMILLDSKRPDVTESNTEKAEPAEKESSSAKASEGQGKKVSKAKKEEVQENKEEEIAPDDIPF